MRTTEQLFLGAITAEQFAENMGRHGQGLDLRAWPSSGSPPRHRGEVAAVARSTRRSVVLARTG